MSLRFTWSTCLYVRRTCASTSASKTMMASIIRNRTNSIVGLLCDEAMVCQVSGCEPLELALQLGRVLQLVRHAPAGRDVLLRCDLHAHVDLGAGLVRHGVGREARDHDGAEDD